MEHERMPPAVTIAGHRFIMQCTSAASAVVLTLLLTPWPWAVAAAQSPMAGARSLRCTFSRAAVATWSGQSAPNATVRPATLTLRFESIDLDTGVAQLRNGTIASDLTVRFAEGYLHFVQAFRTGPLYTTTVFEAGAANGKYRAVHSRHEYFAVPLPEATSSPEQYYGECAIVQ